MSFFGGGSGSPTVDKPNYTGVQIQTAVNTLPIPIIYGQNRIAPNLIDYTDYSSHADGSQSGGKGGSDSSAQQTYSATILMGLCEGPIIAIGRVWVNSSTTTNYQSVGFGLFLGNANQTAWDYMVQKHSDRALNYPSTAYLVAANYNLGSSPNLPNHSFEVDGFFAGTSGYVGNGDADMAFVIRDFLTNPQYGVGFPDSSIDLPTLLSGTYLAGNGVSNANDASYQTYCRSIGLFFSPALVSQESASSILQRWLQLTNTAAVWSGTTLKFIPYGDEVVPGNGCTYTPDVTPIYDLTDDDFIAASDADPIEVTRSDLADSKNCTRVEIADRNNAYNLIPIEAKDQNAIELYGLRVDSSISATEICDPGIAAVVAQLILQRGIHIRNTYTFKLSWEYCLLEPMDLVTLTDPALGMNKTAVRITTIEEDEEGLLTVTAEEFPAGIATATLYPKQGRDPYLVNYNTPAEPVNTPVIFEPAASLTGNGPAQVWIGASGGQSNIADPYWGGCDVYISTDNETYLQAGSIKAPARQGLLSANLPLVTGTDTTSTLAIDTSESGAVINDATNAAAQANQTLIWVDGEIMAYGRAQLTSLGHYNITYLIRGLYGTTPSAHVVGAQFLRLDQAVFQYDLPAQYVGIPIYIKLPSYNIWGGGRESLADAHAYGITPTGVGYFIAAPTGALLTSSARTAGDGTHVLSVALTWNPSAGPLLDSYEAQWKLTGDAAWNSVIVGGNVTDYVIKPAVENATYQGQVRAISTYGNQSAWDVAGNVGSGALSTTVPSTPTGLTASSGAAGANILAWNRNPEPDIEGYRLFSVLGHDTNFADAALIADLNALTYTHTNLGYGEAREYWVEAYNIAGASSPCGPAFGVTSYTIDIGGLIDGFVSESSLLPELASKIDLSADNTLQGIITQATTAQSVQNDLTAARNDLTNYADGVGAKSQSLITDIDVRVSGNYAEFKQETVTRADADSALSEQITTLTASTTTATDAVAASVTTEQEARTNGDSALSNSITSLSSTVTGNASAASANLATEASTRATNDTSISNSVTALNGTVTTNYGTLNGFITTETGLRIDGDNSNASAISALSSTVSGNYGTLNSAIGSEASTRASADSTNADNITALGSTVSSNYSTLNSAISSEASTRSSGDSTNASNISTLQSTVTTNYSTLSAAISTEASTRASAISGVTSQYSIKVQATSDGRVALAGIGLLANIQSGGTIQSEVDIIASKFIVVDTDEHGNLVRGQGFVVSNGNLYVNAIYAGAISCNQITTGSVTSAEITIQPTGGGGGLNVYDQAGNKIIDSATGLFPGSASVQAQASVPSLLLGSLQPVFDQAIHMSGRMVMIYVRASSDYNAPSGNDINMQISILIDGAEIYGNNTLPTGVTNIVPFMINPPSGDHQVTVKIGTRTGSGTYGRNIQTYVIDYKA